MTLFCFCMFSILVASRNQLCFVGMQSVDTCRLYTGEVSMDMDISIDIHVEFIDVDMDIDAKFHIHGKPGYF